MGQVIFTQKLQNDYFGAKNSHLICFKIGIQQLSHYFFSITIGSTTKKTWSTSATGGETIMINQDLIFHVSMLQVNGSTFHTFSILQQIPSQIGTSWMSGSIEGKNDNFR